VVLFFRSFFVLAFAGVILAGCGGGSSSSSPSAPTIPNAAASNTAASSNGSTKASASDVYSYSVLKAGALPAPFDNSSGYVPKRATALTLKQIDPLPQHYFLRTSASSSDKRAADGYVSTTDYGGTQGWFIDNVGNGSVWAATSAQNAAQGLYLPYTTSPQFPGNFLYAPTTKGPQQNCIESVVDYSNTSVGMTYAFVIADWCQADSQHHPRYYAIAMDSNFFNNYVRTYTNGNGLPEFEQEVWYQNGQWYQLLYNNLTAQYDNIYATSGVVDSTVVNRGWSVFETHYNAGINCPTFTTAIGVSGLRYFDGASWQMLGFGTTTPQTPTAGQNQCFNSADPPYYYQVANTSDWGWTTYTY
jgi:hypothetical protein